MYLPWTLNINFIQSLFRHRNLMTMFKIGQITTLLLSSVQAGFRCTAFPLSSFKIPRSRFRMLLCLSSLQDIHHIVIFLVSIRCGKMLDEFAPEHMPASRFQLKQECGQPWWQGTILLTQNKNRITRHKIKGVYNTNTSSTLNTEAVD